MASRELIVLGTASQAPTRHRNHNGYLLRWDGEGLLFDPGEGTQRQMLLARVAAHDVHRICVSHLHGDHCLGLPGVLQRANLDRVPHPLVLHYPASGAEYIARLRHASVFHEMIQVREEPSAAAHQVLAEGPPYRLESRLLDHPVEAHGYRLTEPDGHRMLPAALAARGIAGPDVGRLQREGRVTAPDGTAVGLDEVSEPRPGQVFAFVMDTRMCAAVHRLAEGADLLAIESTFLDRDAALADAHGHLTAGAAARAARDAGVRTLVLTHFSQRYTEPREFLDEASAFFPGEIVVAEDLTRVAVPRRAGARPENPRGSGAARGYHETPGPQGVSEQTLG
ncbi:ribonuclease Z [Mangrovactinospora gilvigrisea]|uniref:Ribonuclease Z n=1 Tax=Mangrovactinospora gilvigrisea TaxID=1428644 RepID=A0A1J7BG83_9ACTN|nr:ribonuclease Z [Mangrovactinospora gilvigrisea]OIV37675.1 ribonuclease Z [Mangrovactinospora gilvigrisea]